MMMNYSINTSWRIGRELQTNPIASFAFGSMVYMVFFLLFGVEFSNAETLLKITGMISFVIIPIGIGNTLGFYLWGLYYQYAIKNQYGPKTLKALIEHLESKSLEKFDIEAVAQLYNKHLD
jgi:hypothetical protein